MKTKISFLLLLSLLVLGLAACQTDQSEVQNPQPQATSTDMPAESESESPAAEPTQEQPANVESGYPAPETQPTKPESQPAGESAYPVTQEDLQLLFHTWSLTNYFVDEVSQDTGLKTIKFNPDGSYELTTDEGSQSGQWRTQLSAVQSKLIFESEAGATTYEIVDLTPSALNLRTTQDNQQIDEQYLPAD